MQPMTTLEKVARAICCPSQKCALGADDRRCAAAEGSKFQARATLLALREPSAGMRGLAGDLWRDTLNSESVAMLSSEQKGLMIFQGLLDHVLSRE